MFVPHNIQAARSAVVFGTSSLEHPGVATLASSGSHCLAGTSAKCIAQLPRFNVSPHLVHSGHIEALNLPARLMECETPRFVFDFWIYVINYSSFRQLRARIPDGKHVVAFQCRNPIHKAHYELFSRISSTMPDAMVQLIFVCLGDSFLFKGTGSSHMRSYPRRYTST